eukprot:COSAG02_NODE_25568_length_654_cov_6.996396_1_plen_75_part_00
MADEITQIILLVSNLLSFFMYLVVGHRYFEIAGFTIPEVESVELVSPLVLQAPLSLRLVTYAFSFSRPPISRTR